MEQSKQLAFTNDLSSATPYRDAVLDTTNLAPVDCNKQRCEVIINTNLPHTQRFTSFSDFATGTPYRDSDLNYAQQLLHLAFGQLPAFRKIDVNIFLQFCIRTKARLLPRTTTLLWHQIFSDEVVCEYCTTVQACTFCFECNKILCPDCTHAVSREGARCFDCIQTLIGESNHRPKPSCRPRPTSLTLGTIHQSSPS